MNYYSILPLIAIITNTGLIIVVLAKDFRSKSNRVYALMSALIGLWALGELVSYNTREISRVLLIDKFLLTPSSLLMILLLLYFLLLYSRNAFLQKKHAWLLMLLPYSVVQGLAVSTNLITKTAESAYWGYRFVPGSLYILLLVYMAGYTTWGLTAVYLHLKTINNKEKRSQTKLLIIGITIPLVGGVFLEAIPSMLGIEIIPLTTILTTFTAIFIGYAILKYNLMTINPSLVSKNIMANMSDILIVTDHEFKIKFVNRALLQEIGMEKYRLIDKDINIFFKDEKDWLQEFQKKRKVANFITEISFTLKKIIPVSINASVFRDKLGRVVGYIFVMRNITEVSRLIKTLEQDTWAQETSKAELEATKINLEKQVKALETANRKVVDRELEMIRIKKEIAKYKEAKVVV